MKNYKKIILNNGIPLYLCVDKSFKQVFVNYIIKYGSDGKWFDFKLNEKQYHVLPGYAHFLEHLLGEHSKSGNIYTNFNDRGYYTNAYTDKDHTSYYFYGIGDIKKSIKELIEAIECPVFTEKDVEQTKHAIEEEAVMWCDNHDITAVSLAEKNLYGGYDVYDETLSCIGNRKTTKEISTIDLYNCYNAFYSDDKKVLVMVGNLDEDELVDYLNETYSKISYPKYNLILPSYNLDPIRKRDDVIYRDVKTDINSMGIKIKKPSTISNEYFQCCIDFIFEYLYGEDSEFFLDLTNKKLIDFLYYMYFTWNGDYINFIHSFISLNGTDYCEAVLEKLNDIDISREDFNLIRKSLIVNHVRELDDKYANPSKFGSRMSYTDNYSSIDCYKNIDYDNFMMLIKKMDFNNYTVGQVKSLKR